MDAEEFDAFYSQSARRLVGQLTLMIGDHAEAQDCVQEAFVRAWNHRRHLSVDGHPEAWVRTTAHRLAVSRWRRATAGLRAYVRHGPPPAVHEPEPNHVALMDALRRLSPTQREAIVLHHLCDLSVEEVAREVGSPVGTVKARLSRGRTALADLLTDQTRGGTRHE